MCFYPSIYIYIYFLSLLFVCQRPGKFRSAKFQEFKEVEQLKKWNKWGKQQSGDDMTDGDADGLVRPPQQLRQGPKGTVKSAVPLFRAPWVL